MARCVKCPRYQEFFKDHLSGPRVGTLVEERSPFGVRQLGSRISRQLQRRDQEDRRLESILVTERELRLRGYQCIGGVDEVGAGPLAGPVVAAAVIVDPEHSVRGVKDSKKLSAKERARLERELLDSVKASALGWVSPAEIDELNIYQASLTAMKRAVEGLKPSADFLLVDARTIPDTDIPQMPIIGGDNRSYAIAAASILAKEARIDTCSKSTPNIRTMDSPVTRGTELLST